MQVLDLGRGLMISFLSSDMEWMRVRYQNISIDL